MGRRRRRPIFPLICEGRALPAWTAALRIRQRLPHILLMPPCRMAGRGSYRQAQASGATVTQKTNLGPFLSDELPSDSRHSRQLVRRQMIAEAVMAEGSMRIEDLTERFGISLMTAHRDVDELVGRGLFRKTRGIVSAAATSLIESSDVYRATK